jgi:hypothetical protein
MRQAVLNPVRNTCFVTGCNAGDEQVGGRWCLCGSIVMGVLRSNGTDPKAIRAANELSVVPFGADTQGMIQGQDESIHTLITVSHTNPVVMWRRSAT